MDGVIWKLKRVTFPLNGVEETKVTIKVLKRIKAFYDSKKPK